MTFEKLFNMIERMLQGEYSPWEFSYAFPEKLIEHEDVLTQENSVLFDEVQENFPDICAGLEDNEDSYKTFKETVKKEYDRVKAFCN